MSLFLAGSRLDSRRILNNTEREDRIAGEELHYESSGKCMEMTR